MQCATVVKKDAVRRETIDGVEHVIVSSYTLPDDIVMNGGLYPASEIAESYESLERTLAPVEHPTDADGKYISATDSRAIDNFYAGASNVNVTRENGRIHIEKHINVHTALKTDRGKRLMDRIIELETNEKARPLHTSVGAWLTVEPLDAPRTNAAGDEYSWIARDMVFDHDAILLDSIAAAPPEKGVGMAVNLDGEYIDVDIVKIDDVKDYRASAEGMSKRDLTEQLDQAIHGIISADWSFIVDIFDDVAIFETNSGIFQVPYRVDDGTVTIVGIPIRVDRNVTYTPKVNNSEGDAMKEMIVNALKEAGIETDGLNDVALFDAYNQLQANQSDGDDAGDDTGDDLSEVVTNALVPLAERLDSIEAKMNSQASDEHDKLAKIVGNSDKFPGLDEEAAKKLDTQALKSMAANCGEGYGLPLDVHNDAASDEFAAPAEMPK